MSFENLAAIKQAEAEKDLSVQRHNTLLTAQGQTQESILSAATAIIQYLEGHVSKTQVVNQLESINTPDALVVAEAVNALHNTIKSHKETDLTEITKLMQGVLDEAKQIPKALPEEKEQKFIDYTPQYKAMTDAVKAVEKVVKAQKLVAEAPIVNVPETNVQVDAPDLKPLQTSIKDVVKAVQKIVIPEYKTDNKAVEKLIKDSNKLLKDILDKPVSRGGGGGGRATPYQTGQDAPAFVTLETDGSIPVTDKSKATAAYSISAISETATNKYFFFEDASLNWYILRKNLTTYVFSYAKGTGGYTSVYVDATSAPSPAPTYGTYGGIF